jgi:hypothetical protein
MHWAATRAAVRGFSTWHERCNAGGSQFVPGRARRSAKKYEVSSMSLLAIKS